MSKKRNSASETATKAQVRCAIYTRKSSEEGLEQDFNSLDAQRDSGEAYIAAQKHEGWVCLPDRYDDGGFTGGNMDRPAAQRLVKDIEAGKVDCVIVYKVDRLSRSLADFARLMDVFEKHHVTFVSVTQAFNTTHSMGRLTLNILLSFAQFEREIISERTRDKIAGARRKGKFAGGRPILGYDIVRTPSGSKLVVNNAEAKCVREIFGLYLQHQSLIPTVKEMANRGWTTKLWQTKKGRSVGGRAFDKNLLYHLLTNVVYVGKIRHHDQVYAGEHDAIVDEQTWQRVQSMLQHNGRTGGSEPRNKHGALLRGILRCVPCNCSMVHTFTCRQTKRYRYYVCLKAQKRGWHTCPTKSVPAGEIEKFVIDQIRSVGRDPTVLAETLRQAKGQNSRNLADLQAQEQALQRELGQCNTSLKKLAAGSDEPTTVAALADVQDRMRRAEQRLTEIRQQIGTLSGEVVDEREVATALSVFDPVWDTLSPREQARIVNLLVERVDYDGENETVAVTFRPNGIKTLAQEINEVAA